MVQLGLGLISNCDSSVRKSVCMYGVITQVRDKEVHERSRARYRPSRPAWSVQQSKPLSHSTMAFCIGNDISIRRQLITYTLSHSCVALISVSRIYLGVSTLCSVVMICITAAFVFEFASMVITTSEDKLANQIKCNSAVPTRPLHSPYYHLVQQHPSRVVSPVSAALLAGG